MKRTHLVLVELSIWALSANPMHQLAAAKGGLVEINAICSIAQVVPFRQQMLLRCFKCWLTCSRSPCLSFTILGKTTVTRGTLRNLTSPLVAACWPLPLSPNQPPSGCLRMFAGFLAVTICYSAFCIHAEPCISLVQACIAIGSVRTLANLDLQQIWSSLHMQEALIEAAVAVSLHGKTFLSRSPGKCACLTVCNLTELIRICTQPTYFNICH